MLAIQIQFLTDLDTLPGQALLDWPPQRSQLLCALADTAQKHRLSASARGTLLWLEEQLSPATHAVPSIIDGRRRLTVTYVWHDAQPDATVRRILHNIVERIAVLGPDGTPVRVRLCESVPDPFAGASASRPETPRRRPWQRRSLHRTIDRNPTPTTVSSGPFGEMIVFRISDVARPSVLDTLEVTTRLRATLLKHCGYPERTVPEVLSGHDGENAPSCRPHAAYVALPGVGPGSPDADGRLAGLAIVLPANFNGSERGRVHQVARAIRGLWMPGGEELPLELLLDHDRPPVLRPQTWSAPSRRWVSVTPVVLDRFPRRDGRDVEDLIRWSCRNLGLPEATEILVGREGPLPGTPSSDRFPIRRREPWQHHTLGDDPVGPPRPSFHVTLVFAEPVRGPLLLGQSRHFGLGLLKPSLDGLRRA